MFRRGLQCSCFKRRIYPRYSRWRDINECATGSTGVKEAFAGQYALLLKGLRLQGRVAFEELSSTYSEKCAYTPAPTTPRSALPSRSAMACRVGVVTWGSAVLYCPLLVGKIHDFYALSLVMVRRSIPIY